MNNNRLECVRSTKNRNRNRNENPEKNSNRVQFEEFAFTSISKRHLIKLLPVLIEMRKPNCEL